MWFRWCCFGVRNICKLKARLWQTSHFKSGSKHHLPGHQLDSNATGNRMKPERFKKTICSSVCSTLYLYGSVSWQEESIIIRLEMMIQWSCLPLKSDQNLSIKKCVFIFYLFFKPQWNPNVMWIVLFFLWSLIWFHYVSFFSQENVLCIFSPENNTIWVRIECIVFSKCSLAVLHPPSPRYIICMSSLCYWSCQKTRCMTPTPPLRPSDPSGCRI